MTDIYKQLRKQIDQYSIGYPETQSGVEIQILKKLFTEEEADVYLNLSMLLEDSNSIANRLNRDVKEMAEILERMAQKGLLFRYRKQDAVKYACTPFVVGFYEYQLKDMDSELAQMVEVYFEEGMLKHIVNNVVPLRTVPVNQSLKVQHQVAPYEDARQIVKSKSKIAVAECICRKQQHLVEKGCDKPREVCLMFGSHAAYYVENKMARFIDQDEALSILDQCEEAGLVNQPANMINPGGMCNCCGDCCGVLRALNALPKPAEMVYNNYWAQIDPDVCVACEVCADRCQMEAISFEAAEYGMVNQDRCIGCGLCVTTCPTEAIQLMLKPEAQRKNMPQTGQELSLITAETRGTSLIPLNQQ